MRAVWMLLIGMAAVMSGACAEQQGKSYWLRHAPVTLSQAVEIAETNGPGRAVGPGQPDLGDGAAPITRTQ